MKGCGLSRVPSRRTFDRRLVTISKDIKSLFYINNRNKLLNNIYKDHFPNLIYLTIDTYNSIRGGWINNQIHKLKEIKKVSLKYDVVFDFVPN